MDCSGLLGRTSLRQQIPDEQGRGCAPLFRPSRPDFIETSGRRGLPGGCARRLFRPSRPDFIETPPAWVKCSYPSHCSGLLGRTSLRRPGSQPPWRRSGADCSGLLGRTSLRLPGDLVDHRFPILFRSSRPDFIETRVASARVLPSTDCSGLLGRTSLRRSACRPVRGSRRSLFRPSRSDFIETDGFGLRLLSRHSIVPAFWIGLL